MTDSIVILVTTKNRAEAEKIGTGLVEKRLAACVNIFDGVRSIFRWEGAVQKTDEALMVVKTRRDLFVKIEKYVRQTHSYRVPEIIALPIQEGFDAYLKWISASTEE